MSKSDWVAREPELRAEWETRFGTTGLDWEEIREAHCFGWTAALLPEFADVDFETAVPDLLEHWSRRISATEEAAWDYVSDAAEEGWRQARAHDERAAGI